MDNSNNARGPCLPRGFFDVPARLLAPRLIGTIIVRTYRGKDYRARIVETEAYLGPADRASHASHGRTRRTEVLYGLPGRLYIYLIYGLHCMLNIVAGAQEGDAQCVLVRAALPLDGWTADLWGPGRLTRGLRIGLEMNAREMGGTLRLLPRESRYRARTVVAPRVGIDYAGEWRDAPLRWIEGGTKSRSGGRAPSSSRA